MYQTRNQPPDASPLAMWTANELQEVSRTLLEPQELLNLAVMHRPPVKPPKAFLAVADGTDWNPGAGAGLYFYRNGTYTKIA